jgi:hypothetical protein
MTKLLPLTRSLCLRIGDEQDYTISYALLDKRTVRMINQNIASNAERFVFGPDRCPLESLIDRCQLQTLPWAENWEVKVLDAVSGDDGRLIKYTRLAGKYFY